MMRTLQALLLAGVLAPAVCGQAAVAPPAMMAPPKQPAPAADKDNLDFLYLGSDRPVLLRVHVRKGDKPYFSAWDAYVKRLFDYFDLDHDGKLSKKEAGHIPQAQSLAYQLQGVIVGIGFQKAPWDQLDRNKDGKVTPRELGEYLRTGGIEPMMTTDSSTRSTSDEVTATLYRRLDTNKDGKLTQEELKKAPALLAGLDSNEDEALTSEELRGTSSSPYGYAVALNAQSQPINAESGLVQIQSEAAHAGLARQLLGRYDRNKDSKLSRGESGLDQATFNKLDGNHDGQLNAAELAGFFRREADLELVARPSPARPVANAATEVINMVSKGLGLTSVVPRSADVFNPSKRDMPLASRLRRDNPQGVAIVLGDTDLSLAVPLNQNNNFGVKQYYLQQFQMADTKKKGYLERKQATDPFLGQFFEMADRKGEGKMYEKDLKALLEIQEEGVGCRLQLDVNDEGRSLFDLLDANHDGRLSQRELRDGWEQLKSSAHGKDGLARGDISRRVQVQLVAGGNQYGPRAVVAIAYGGSTPAAAPGQAPRWFTKMDRNHDNDVSRAEFLGPEEVFGQMDADGDGLISVKEAQRYEQARKKGK